MPGLDLGKLQDYSAIVVIQRDEDEKQTPKVVYKHEFPLETPYTEVIATTARINEQFKLQKLLGDQTGIGEPILEKMHNEQIAISEGTALTQDTKAELLINLKLAIEQQRLAITYDKKFCQQINDQQYAIQKAENSPFSTPQTRTTTSSRHSR